MRVFGAISAALVLGSAAAFVPQAKPQAPKIDFSKVVAPVVTVLGLSSSPMMVPPAHADGSVSAATVTRAGVLYGPRVIKLKSAVDKADFAAIQAEDGAARLFNSGAFATNKPLQKKVQAAYADVQKAVQAKDAAALKSAWSVYFKTAKLDQTNPFSSKDRGQQLSSDFSPLLKNPVFE